MYDYEREAEMVAEDLYNGVCDYTEPDHYDGYYTDLGDELSVYYPEYETDDYY